MIDLAAIESLVQGGAGRVLWESDGGTAQVVPARGGGPAVLVVDQITDAVKEVEGDRLIGSLDRDALWAVLAVELDAEVVSGLVSGSGSDVMEIDELIERVRQSGYEWQVTPFNPSGL